MATDPLLHASLSPIFEKICLFHPNAVYQPLPGNKVQSRVPLRSPISRFAYTSISAHFQVPSLWCPLQFSHLRQPPLGYYNIQHKVLGLHPYDFPFIRLQIIRAPSAFPATSFTCLPREAYYYTRGFKLLFLPHHNFLYTDLFGGSFPLPSEWYYRGPHS